MGIKNLKQWLRKNYPDCISRKHISEYRYEKIGVDISSYLYKYKCVFGDSWINCFPNLVCSFKRNDVHAVFVFDGKPPPEKDREISKRREDRDNIEIGIQQVTTELELYSSGVREPERLTELLKCMTRMLQDSKSWEKQNRLMFGTKAKTTVATPETIDVAKIQEWLDKKTRQLVHISREDITKLQTLLTLFGASWILAPGEAEAMCCKMYRDGHVKAVLSEDTDVLCYGCESFLSDYNTANGNCEYISLGDVLQQTKLSFSSFRDYCIMCGTDYNSNIPGVGPQKTYRLITTHNSIEDVPDSVGDKSILNYVRSREIFETYGGLTDYVMPGYWNSQIDWGELCNFMYSNNIRFNETQITELWNNSDEMILTD
jgi:5'-3' exonuclease